MPWTIILPAAGRGTRLAFDGPKTLYTVAGKSILEHLIQRFKTYNALILVTSPERPVMFEGIRSHGRMSVVQAAPLGMADAVAAALAFVTTDYVCVCWGDQIVTSDTLIQRCMSCVEVRGADVSCPVYIADTPYIVFKREGGRIVKVLQRREGDEMPVSGESDMGMFFFRTAVLRHVMSEADIGVGAITGEHNFVPLLPLFQKQASVLGKREDVLGINTVEEAKRAEEILACL